MPPVYQYHIEKPELYWYVFLYRYAGLSLSLQTVVFSPKTNAVRRFEIEVPPFPGVVTGYARS